MTRYDTTYGRTARRTVTAGASLVALTGTAAAHGGGATGGGMMGGGWGLLGGAMGVFGLLWMGLLVALPLILAYRLLGGTGGSDGPSREGERTLATLRERYARGELSDEEFERRRDRLDRTG